MKMKKGVSASGCLLHLLIAYVTVIATALPADSEHEDDGDMFHNAANLRREFSPSTTNPRITEHPQDDFFPRNEPASLNCKAEGDPEPNITWYKDGELVETTKNNPISHRMLLDNGQLFFLRVIHSKNNQPDIGVYYCNATNVHGSAISHSANVQIAVLKDKFLEEPTDQIAAVGKSVTLQCDPPRGKPDPKVIWRKNGEPVQTDDRVHITDSGNLEIYSVEKKDIGEYLCVAINKGGEKQSAPAKVHVLDVPVFHKLPKDVSTEQGSTAEFYCDVMGDPPITVTWTKKDGAIQFGRARILADHTLRIEKVESSDDGVYICSAMNAAGSTQATARLTVFAKPSFLIKPQDQVVVRGRTVSLQCVPTGNPPPTVFWSKESEGVLMFSNTDSEHYTVTEDGTLRIQGVNESDAGDYQCEALNIRGAARASARIQVIDSVFNLPASDSRPPPIIKLGPQNQTLAVGSMAVMRCIGKGKPEPILRWYRNGRPLLMTDPRMKFVDAGTLHITDLQLQDSGSYTCKAVSETGETIWDAFLTVFSKSSGQKARYSPAETLLPDPPTKPVVSDVTDTTVHLSWAPSTQNNQYPVQKFYVEYFGFETTDGWVIASRDVKRESYTVEKLSRNTTYMFLVRAVNSQGVGYPSLVSEPIRTLAQQYENKKQKLTDEELKARLNSNLVELTETVALNSSAINISWTIPKQDSIIEGYQIEYRHIKEMDIRNRKYGESHVIRVSPSRTWHLVRGLQSYNWYELRVCTYSGKLQSWYSRPVLMQTEQTYKAGSPEDVSVHQRNGDSISVLWSPPTSSASLVTGYQVSCFSKDGRENCSRQTDARTFSVIIDKLNPNKAYDVKVAARTQKGVGAWSNGIVFDSNGVHVSNEAKGTVTEKPVAQEESSDTDLFKKPWFVGLCIGVGGVMLWLVLCIFSIWLCKRKKQRKKMKDQRYYTGVPIEKKEECSKNMRYPPQYAMKPQNINNSNELRVLLPGQGKKETDHQDENIYKMAGDGGFPEMKTFYQKVDPVAPYATTALIQQQHLLKQRQQQGMDQQLFRPINQGYIQHSEGSGDSCVKAPLSSDSNPDHSQHSQHSGHSTTDHNHCSEHLSPTSDSGGHSTDDNNLLIKQRKKVSSRRENTGQKVTVNVNWSEMLPPPPEHPPPPSECTEPPSYNELHGAVRSAAHSPMSPISFSQLSACSCPNPQTHTPVSGWNVPIYSDTECPRCASEQYYDPRTYCQEAYIRPTNSPRNHLVQHVNNRNIVNNAGTGHSCPPRGGSANIHYQITQPHSRASVINYTNSAADNTYNSKHLSNIKQTNNNSHSDNESGSVLPCFQSYRITPKSEPEARFMQDEWGPEPAPPCHNCEQDSGMGMEEDGVCVDRTCHMDRACQSSLPSLAPSQHNGEYDGRNCDSPQSDVADYTETEYGHNHPQNTVGVDGNTDCSSVQSSTGSSGDGTFLTEEDFASAVARAAELSGLTVVGTTICDPNVKSSKKDRRVRRPARPVSPGYSTDSNYGTIDMVRKPYPKSQRKQQLIDQGKVLPNVRSSSSTHTDNHDKNLFVNPNEASPYDTPFSRMDYPVSFSNPVTPLSPHRFASLNRMSRHDGSRSRHYDRGSHSTAGSDRGGYSSFLPHSIVTMPMKEDIV